MVPDTKSLVALILFLVSGGVIVCITAAYHRALRNLHAEQEKRELLVKELVHRSRNTFAVASLIVNRTLRDHADIARAINGRLKALLSTNETLIFSDRQSCSLLQLLRNELEPYPWSASRLPALMCNFTKILRAPWRWSSTSLLRIQRSMARSPVPLGCLTSIGT